MSTYIVNDEAFADDPNKQADDDRLLAVRFTVEQRLNHALMTRIADINRSHEAKAELLDAAHKFDEAKAEREKKLSEEPVYRDIEFISINMPGDKTFAIHRPVNAADRRRFRTKYEAWKTSQGMPVEGTPIEQLPEISLTQTEQLKYVGITTIEQMARVSDGSPIMSMMGGVGLKQRAAAWVQKNRKASIVNQTNEALKERDAQIAKLQEQVASLIASVEAARANEPQKAARK